jgi:hypothetical protein
MGPGLLQIKKLCLAAAKSSRLMRRSELGSTSYFRGGDRSGLFLELCLTYRRSKNSYVSWKYWWYLSQDILCV